MRTDLFPPATDKFSIQPGYIRRMAQRGGPDEIARGKTAGDRRPLLQLRHKRRSKASLQLEIKRLRHNWSNRRTDAHGAATNENARVNFEF